MNEISALTKETPGISHTPSALRGHSKKTACPPTRKWALSRHWIYQCLILDFQELWEINFYCSSATQYMVFCYLSPKDRQSFTFFSRLLILGVFHTYTTSQFRLATFQMQSRPMGLMADLSITTHLWCVFLYVVSLYDRLQSDSHSSYLKEVCGKYNNLFRCITMLLFPICHLVLLPFLAKNNIHPTGELYFLTYVSVPLPGLFPIFPRSPPLVTTCLGATI